MPVAHDWTTWRRMAAVCIALLALACLASPVSAQSPAAAPAARSRVALVIGQGAYLHTTQLTNPVNDAQDVAQALRGLGFTVTLGLDLDRRGFDEALRTFTKGLGQADTALLFYAGHGLQVGGQNWLVPVDARLEGERDLEFEGVRLEFVLRQMEIDREGRTNIVFLDACRDNPLARNLARSMGTRSAGIGRGLAQAQTGVGTFIAYATQPGNVALDGDGRNSPFTSALVRRIGEPGKPLTGVMVDVRNDVLGATGGRQVPWDHSALTAEFYFQPAAATGAPGLPDGAAKPGREPAELRERVRTLEQDLKTKDATASAAAAAALSQLKGRARDLDEAIRAERERLFEAQRRSGQETDPQKRQSLQGDVFRAMKEMGRQGQERKQVQVEIEKLEGLTGAAATK